MQIKVQTLTFELIVYSKVTINKNLFIALLNLVNITLYKYEAYIYTFLII